MSDFTQFLLWEQSSRDTIDVKKTYMDMAEDMVAGIILSQIVYWHLPTKKGDDTKLRVERDGHLWIAKARHDWWEECRATPKQVDRALKILASKELIEIKMWKFAGDRMTHVRVRQDNFLAAWEDAINNPPTLHTYKGRGAESSNVEKNLQVAQKSTSKSPKSQLRSKPKVKDGLNLSATPFSTESTAQSTSKSTTSKAAAEFENPLSAERLETLTNSLIALRIEPTAARKLASEYSERIEAVTSYWSARGFDGFNKPAGVVRSSIEHPDKWPDVYETPAAATSPAQPAPPRLSIEQRREKYAAAYESVWAAMPSGERNAVEREGRDRFEYIEMAHKAELAAAMRQHGKI